MDVRVKGGGILSSSTKAKIAADRLRMRTSTSTPSAGLGFGMCWGVRQGAWAGTHLFLINLPIICSDGP